MKKVALCFSGILNNFDYCIPSIIKNFINVFKKNDYKVDIFLYLNIINNKNKFKNNFKIINYEIEIKKIIDILKPIDYIINDYDPEIQKKECTINNINFLNTNYKNEKEKKYAINGICMYYKIFKCNKLKSNYEKKKKFKYDLVWRARLDYNFLKELAFPFELYPFKNMSFIINDRYVFLSKRKNNDKFFGGSSKIMDELCNIYHTIPEIYSSGLSLNGQQLIKNRLRIIKCKCHIIGHRNTYLKCKTTKIKKKSNIINYYIDIDDIDLNFEICYKLLYSKYRLNDIKIISFLDNDILKLFKNYNYLEKNNLIKKYENIKISDKHKIIKSIDEHKILLNNSNIIYYSKRYISNIIINYIDNKEKKNYLIENKIYNPLINENIIVNIPDRGSWLGIVTIIENINKQDMYFVEILNEKFKNKYKFKWYYRDEINIINWNKHLIISN
jgi:hypothetical protein